MDNIIYIANVQKFDQNSNLLEVLFETSGSNLVEMSPHDKEWNLGKCLERVRAELLERNFNEALEQYETYTDLEVNGPPPFPEFYGYDIGRQEANYECMLDAIQDDLKRDRENLKYHCKFIIRGGFDENLEKQAHDALKLIYERANKFEDKIVTHYPRENKIPYKVSIRRVK